MGRVSYSQDFKDQVIACYITRLNYHEVARITGISVNGVKGIVQNAKKKQPKRYARISTEINKKAKIKHNNIIYKLMDAYETKTDKYLEIVEKTFNISEFSKLLTLIHKEDTLYYKREKELYEAKTWALTYECKRIERAILLRDAKELLKIIENSEDENNTYEPLDMNFLGMKTRYDTNDFNVKKVLSKKERGKYNSQIESYLVERGYLVRKWR
jgi:hypothetical protein